MFAIARIIFYKISMFSRGGKSTSAKFTIPETCTCPPEPKPKPTPEPTPEPTQPPGDDILDQCLDDTPRKRNAFCRRLSASGETTVEAFNFTKGKIFKCWCEVSDRVVFEANSIEEFQAAKYASERLCDGATSECLVKFKYTEAKTFYSFVESEPAENGCAAIIGYSPTLNDIGKIKTVDCKKAMPFFCLASVSPPEAPKFKDGPCHDSDGNIKGRVALTFDGNMHDKDDWAAAPVAIALLAKYNLQDTVVHFDYNNNIGKTETGWEAEMVISAENGASKFNFNMGNVFNMRSDIDGTINHLKTEIEKSSTDDPLCIIAGGPMETLWRAFSAADDSYYEHTTVISHSNWNNRKHYNDSESTHTKEDILDLGNINWAQIKDQNRGLHTEGFSDFAFLKEAGGKWEWIYNRIVHSEKPDVSDAGMVYWWLTGNENGTPSDVKTMLGL